MKNLRFEITQAKGSEKGSSQETGGRGEEEEEGEEEEAEGEGAGQGS